MKYILPWLQLDGKEAKNSILGE
uniref:Uncharacterized protein n=1 Tax=Tetranychus urticae TaxID=32264 RepID=T1KTF9_TETUR